VFTFGNSRRFETSALRIAIKQIGVDPYYNFNMKGKSEIEQYAVPVARILQERKEEARLLPGIFRTDEPVFNVPFLGKNHLRAWQDHELIAILPDGRRMYSFHPWEKNIDQVKPYLYTDVTIKSYLEKLKERGEKQEEYNSIWYYY
jgi:lysine 2,3-aminomutase